MSKNFDYTIRSFSIPEGQPHSCTGHIVAVLGATQNPTSRMWYLTVLVERTEESGMEAGQA